MQYKRIVPLLAILLAYPLCSAETTSVGSYSKKEIGFYLSHFDRSPDLADFAGKFNGNLYRGGQPDFNQGDEWLKKFKDNSISLVIDLREEAQGLTKERTDLKNAGISYILLPWHTEGTDQPSKLTVTEDLFENGVYSEDAESLDKVIASMRVLQIANDYLDADKRIYVHCQRGEDRTGTFISLLRNLDDNWQKEFYNYGGYLYQSLKKHRADLVQELQKN